jgi:hypothetical protein
MPIMRLTPHATPRSVLVNDTTPRVRVAFAIAAKRAEDVQQVIDQALPVFSQRIDTREIAVHVSPQVFLPKRSVISEVRTKVVRAFRARDWGHGDILGGRSPRRAVGAARSYAAQIG